MISGFRWDSWRFLMDRNVEPATPWPAPPHPSPWKHKSPSSVPLPWAKGRMAQSSIYQFLCLGWGPGPATIWLPGWPQGQGQSLQGPSSSLPHRNLKFPTKATDPSCLAFPALSLVSRPVAPSRSCAVWDPPGSFSQHSSKVP